MASRAPPEAGAPSAGAVVAGPTDRPGAPVARAQARPRAGGDPKVRREGGWRLGRPEARAERWCGGGVADRPT